MRSNFVKNIYRITAIIFTLIAVMNVIRIIKTKDEMKRIEIEKNVMTRINEASTELSSIKAEGIKLEDNKEITVEEIEEVVKQEQSQNVTVPNKVEVINDNAEESQNKEVVIEKTVNTKTESVAKQESKPEVKQEVVKKEEPAEVDESVNLKQTSNTQKVNINGSYYDVESRFNYPKLGISYPVLSTWSDSLLRVSLCKYWGFGPNEVGNYCIVGHNYANGSVFGKLSGAAIGDTFTLTDVNGNTRTYRVYDMYIVEPDDLSCTSQRTNGNVEVTLITCANGGSQRLIIKARS